MTENAPELSDADERWAMRSTYRGVTIGAYAGFGYLGQATISVLWNARSGRILEIDDLIFSMIGAPFIWLSSLGFLVLGAVMFCVEVSLREGLTRAENTAFQLVFYSLAVGMTAWTGSPSIFGQTSGLLGALVAWQLAESMMKRRRARTTTVGA